jgi:hypothetical protein
LKQTLEKRREINEGEDIDPDDHQEMPEQAKPVDP